MRIYTMEASKQEMISHVIAVICGIGCLITFILALMNTKEQSLVLTYTLVSTGLFIAIFIAIGCGNSIGKYARRRALVKDEKGEWFHVYFLKEKPLPIRGWLIGGILGLLIRKMDMEEHEEIIMEREAFIYGPKLKKYLENLWSGNGEEDPDLMVDHIENPRMIKPTLLYYTTGGKQMIFQKMHVYKDCYAYEEFVEWVSQHDTGIDFREVRRIYG